MFLSYLILFSGLIAAAQDINFSQFYELPLLRNPALAGLFKGDIRVVSAYRSQWGSVTVPYLTQALGGEIRLPVSPRDFLSIGMQITNDIAGDSKLGRIQFLPMAAFNKCLNEETHTYLSIGVLGGLVQQRFDPSQLKFDDQFVSGSYSPANATQQTFKTQQLKYWDLNAGLSFSAQAGEVDYYVGAAYFHLSQPKVTFDPTNDLRLNKKIVVNAGVNIPNGMQDMLTVFADVFVQGGNNQWQGGMIYKHDLKEMQADEEKRVSISAGSFFRWEDAVIPVVKLDYNKFALGVTYDINISKLKPASQMRGAYELTLCYRISSIASAISLTIPVAR
ncbi:MAG: PorP/SprF family type IX secretion system membrane protein [Ferruginibacter sp.]